ncbi:MAG: ABC transporter substrate-binding protein [Gammaproteobacteria bacterium]|nr:ABC transporter substrate-binding protein [Gammaproteobacteria bacterium]
MLVACGEEPWNSPYPAADSSRAIMYGSFSERPKHLDPVSSYSENEAVFNGQIYEPVVQYHFLKRPYQLVPLTAVALPEPRYFDADGAALPDDAPREAVAEAVYRITIQRGVRYQPHPAFARDDDGHYVYHDLDETTLGDRKRLADFELSGTRELVAADYVYQIKRLVHPRLHSPLAGLMSKYIKGLGAFGQRLREVERDTGRPVDLREYDFPGARVVDRYTYEIVITEKYPQFRYWLAMSFFAPVPWEADVFYGRPGMKERNISLDWYPVGTGPYMLTDNNPNRRMVLERNPNFRGEAYPSEGEPGDAEAGLLARAGERMPFIDVAYYSLEKEPIPEWTKFLQGYYDVSNVLADSFDQAIRFNAQGEAQLTDTMREKGIQLITAVTTSISYMGFNMLDPVVGGDGDRARLLRRAISIAVDYEELISIFANGRGVPAQGPIPPGIFGHVDGANGINPYVYRWVDGHPVRRDIAEARELMRQAGFPQGRDADTGKQLTLYFETVSGGPGSKSLLNWYRKQFDKLGIQLVIRATDYNRFQEKVRKGTAQIFGWGWNADYPDPENFLFLLYGPNGKVEHHGENAVNYDDQRFDELFVRMRAMADGPERQALIDEMVEIVRRDAPWLWGFHPTAYTLYHSWFGNAKPNLMGRNTLKYKTIDAELRARKRREWNQPVVWPVIALVMVLLVSAIPAWRTYRARQKESVG